MLSAYAELNMIDVELDDKTDLKKRIENAKNVISELDDELLMIFGKVANYEKDAKDISYNDLIECFEDIEAMILKAKEKLF